ncbi:MAG TPA: hypothetical protein VM638_07970 [Actinomycetota bacterium]|nr:hypothetical protein [Actinomycetota bacterium]
MPSPSASRAPAAIRAVAAGFPVLVVLAGWAVVSAIGGRSLPWFVLLAAGGALFLAAAISAACAAHAVVRRRLGWALALVVGWPVLVPVYLLRTVRAR